MGPRNALCRTDRDYPSDYRWQAGVKQTFSRDSVEKELTVKMELKNISASNVYVSGFARYFDGDLDNTRQSDIYDRTIDCVNGREANGLSVTAITGFPATSVHAFASLKIDALTSRGGHTDSAWRLRWKSLHPHGLLSLAKQD